MRMSKFSELKPQYGKARWSRFIEYREAGLNRAESRELSRQKKDHPVVTVMVKQRAAMRRKFDRKADIGKLEDTKREYQWNKLVKAWYLKNGYTSIPWKTKTGKDVRKRRRGGDPDIRVWYRRVSKKLAISEGVTEAELKGRKDRTPRKKQHRGHVTEQTARAKARAKSHHKGYSTSDTVVRKNATGLAAYEKGRGR